MLRLKTILSCAIRRGALVGALSFCLFTTSACGLILYPDRQGQSGGRIDLRVAALDGVGLIFFLVPGLVAYAVDFATGTIYLPRHGAAVEGTFDLDEATALRTDHRDLNAETIEAIVRRQTGHDIALTDPRLRVRRANQTQWQRVFRSNDIKQYAAISRSAS